MRSASSPSATSRFGEPSSRVRSSRSEPQGARWMIKGMEHITLGAVPADQLDRVASKGEEPASRSSTRIYTCRRHCGISGSTSISTKLSRLSPSIETNDFYQAPGVGDPIADTQGVAGNRHRFSDSAMPLTNRVSLSRDIVRINLQSLREPDQHTDVLLGQRGTLDELPDARPRVGNPRARRKVFILVSIPTSTLREPRAGPPRTASRRAPGRGPSACAVTQARVWRVGGVCWCGEAAVVGFCGGGHCSGGDL